MEKLIDLSSYPVSVVLNNLIKDKTTKQNIIFATNAYIDTFVEVTEKSQITLKLLQTCGNDIIQPRVSKSAERQLERTRKNAEVFTPSWICNKMNNYCDAEWFGRENVFNTESEQSWIVNEEKIQFKNSNDWQKYVDSKRIEITCGEAPYVVSRYDAATGEIIPINERIGILDRKLRIVSENTDTEEEWLKWSTRAYQSVYGYEFQGDNLLIARINLLVTYVDYMKDKFKRVPTDKELQKITNIIVWNFWQMDGITGLIPFGTPKEEFQQISLFDLDNNQATDKNEDNVECLIYDWRSNTSLTYNSVKGRE